MRLKRLFLGIMLSAGIANIGAANYTPENVSISLKVPGNDARHYSLTLQKQQDGVYTCQSSEQLPLVITRQVCLLYTSPSPRDRTRSRMPSSA